MLFGDKLKQLRMEKGKTQKELGDILGVSDRIIGYYESNDRFPKDEMILKRIADYFNVSIDYLLNRDTDNTITKLPYEQFIQSAKIHFMGAAPEDQEAIFKDLTDIYFESRMINKEKFNPNKNKHKNDNL